MTVLLTYSRSSKDCGGKSLEFTQKDLNHVRYDKNTVENKEFHLDVAGGVQGRHVPRSYRLIRAKSF